MIPLWIAAGALGGAVLLLLAVPLLRSGKLDRAAKAGLLAALAVPVAAVVLYGSLGQPAWPDLPIAARADEVERAQQFARVRQAVDKLAAVAAEKTTDGEAWMMTGDAYLRLGAFAEAAAAFDQAHALAEDDAVAALAHAEAVVRSEQGMVTPQAAGLFRAVLSLDPGNPRARLFTGLGHAQAGHVAQALAVWEPLAAETADDVPWRTALLDHIARLRAETGRG